MPGKNDFVYNDPDYPRHEQVLVERLRSGENLLGDVYPYVREPSEGRKGLPNQAANRLERYLKGETTDSPGSQQSLYAEFENYDPPAVPEQGETTEMQADSSSPRNSSKTLPSGLPAVGEGSGLLDQAGLPSGLPGADFVWSQQEQQDYVPVRITDPDLQALSGEVTGGGQDIGAFGLAPAPSGSMPSDPAFAQAVTDSLASQATKSGLKGIGFGLTTDSISGGLLGAAMDFGLNAPVSVAATVSNQAVSNALGLSDTATSYGGLLGAALAGLTGIGPASIAGAPIGSVVSEGLLDALDARTAIDDEAAIDALETEMGWADAHMGPLSAISSIGGNPASALGMDSRAPFGIGPAHGMGGYSSGAFGGKGDVGYGGLPGSIGPSGGFGGGSSSGGGGGVGPGVGGAPAGGDPGGGPGGPGPGGGSAGGSGGAGGVCFLPGTLVTMLDGSTRQIDDVQQFEQVLSYDVYGQRLAPGLVVQKSERDGQQGYYTVTFEDGTVLKLTHDHPILTDNGFRACKPRSDDDSVEMGSRQPDLPVTQLQVGDKGMTDQKELSGVVSIEYHDDTVMTYNLEIVEPYHTFFANRRCVHNRT